MRPETEQWIRRTPLDAMICFDQKRHSWPRPTAAAGRRRDGLPPNSKGITWKLAEPGGPSTPRALERTMVCVCGAQRKELFVVRGRTLVRSGKPGYKNPHTRKRAAPDEPLEPLDADVLRGSMVARLYPGLRW